MSKVYVLFERHTKIQDWQLKGVVTDFKVASAWVSHDGRKNYLHKWESTEFNDPELLNRIAKGGSDDS